MKLIVLVAALCALASAQLKEPDEYAVVIGSDDTTTEARVFKWIHREFKQIPTLEFPASGKSKVLSKTLASFAGSSNLTAEIDAFLQPVYDFANTIVPAPWRNLTYAFAYGGAAMRNIKSKDADDIWSAVRDSLRAQTSWIVDNDRVRTLEVFEEGIAEWFDINDIYDALDSPDRSKLHGMIRFDEDSVDITFTPESAPLALSALVHAPHEEYDVYSHSYDQSGFADAWTGFTDYLVEQFQKTNVSPSKQVTVPHPCLNPTRSFTYTTAAYPGFTFTMKGTPVSNVSSPDNCFNRIAVSPLVQASTCACLNWRIPCTGDAGGCALLGRYQPKIAGQFVITDGGDRVLEAIVGPTVYNSATFNSMDTLLTAVRSFCADSSPTDRSKVPSNIPLDQLCFRGMYMATVIAEGFVRGDITPDPDTTPFFSVVDTITSPPSKSTGRNVCAGACKPDWVRGQVVKEIMGLPVTPNPFEPHQTTVRFNMDGDYDFWSPSQLDEFRKKISQQFAGDSSGASVQNLVKRAYFAQSNNLIVNSTLLEFNLLADDATYGPKSVDNADALDKVSKALDGSFTCCTGNKKELAKVVLSPSALPDILPDWIWARHSVSMTIEDSAAFFETVNFEVAVRNALKVAGQDLPSNQTFLTYLRANATGREIDFEQPITYKLTALGAENTMANYGCIEADDMPPDLIVPSSDAKSVKVVMSCGTSTQAAYAQVTQYASEACDDNVTANTIVSSYEVDRATNTFSHNVTAGPGLPSYIFTFTNTICDAYNTTLTVVLADQYGNSSEAAVDALADDTKTAFAGYRVADRWINYQVEPWRFAERVVAATVQDKNFNTTANREAFVNSLESDLPVGTEVVIASAQEVGCRPGDTLDACWSVEFYLVDTKTGHDSTASLQQLSDWYAEDPINPALRDLEIIKLAFPTNSLPEWGIARQLVVLFMGQNEQFVDQPLLARDIARAVQSRGQSSFNASNVHVRDVYMWDPVFSRAIQTPTTGRGGAYAYLTGEAVATVMLTQDSFEIGGKFTRTDDLSAVSALVSEAEANNNPFLDKYNITKVEHHTLNDDGTTELPPTPTSPPTPDGNNGNNGNNNNGSNNRTAIIVGATLGGIIGLLLIIIIIVKVSGAGSQPKTHAAPDSSGSYHLAQ